MVVEAIIKHKFDKNQVSEKFAKREFIATVDYKSQYAQQVLFQLAQAKCDVLDKIPTGVPVVIHFNLRGREWTSPQGELKCFNTLDVWKIDVVNQTQTTQANSSEQIHTSNSANDDLPF